MGGIRVISFIYLRISRLIDLHGNRKTNLIFDIMESRPGNFRVYVEFVEKLDNSGEKENSGEKDI